MQSPSHREPFNTVVEALDGSRPGTPGSSQVRPKSASGSGGMIVRPSSAGTRSMALTTKDAWGAPESPKASPGSPGTPHISGARLRNHAHAIMARRSKEEMAQDVYLLQSSLKEAEVREKKLQTEKQRLELELKKSIQMMSRDKSMFDPCASRAPTLAEQASVVAKPDPALVNKLKDTNRQLRAARDELASELSTLQRSTRVTRATELEAEARMYLEEMDRQKKIAALLEERLKDCQSALAEAQMELNKKKTVLKNGGTASLLASSVYGADESILKDKATVDNDAAPRSLRQELQMATIQAGRGLTGGSKELRATLASMQSAHRLLVAEAAALRNFLPEGCSWADLDPQRWKQAGVSPRGASAILRFLRTHEVRLHGELSGLPGAKRKNKDVQPPAELEGPDYHVLGKDGTTSAAGGPKTPQKRKNIPTPPIKQPVDVEAEMAWKAEAARLRKQMDDHMQNLNQLVEEDSVLGDLGRSSLSMASASPPSTTYLSNPPPAGMHAAQVASGFAAPAKEPSMVSIEEHVSAAKQPSSVPGDGFSIGEARKDIAVDEPKALAPEPQSPGVQVEVDKARQESEELRAKMDAAEAEFQRVGNDPVSEAIIAGAVPPIMIPLQTQLSAGSDFPRVESMDPARNEQMPLLEETRESEEEESESEGEDEDYGDDSEFEDDDYEDDSGEEAEPQAEYRVNEEPMTDTVAAGVLVDSMESNLRMGIHDGKGGNSAGIGSASQEMEGTTQEETPTHVDAEIIPAHASNQGSQESADVSREPSAAISASGDTPVQPQAATPSLQQDLENRDLDLSESSSSNTGAPAFASAGDYQHPNDIPVQAEDDIATANMPDLEVSASGDMASGSTNHGSSLFSEDEGDDDDEEFPPRSPVSSDGDDLIPADDDSDDDDVF